MTVTDLSPAQHDLVLYRGDSVEFGLRLGYLDNGVFVGYDLTDAEFEAQIRAKADSTDVMATFAVTIDDQTDDATRGTLWVRLSATVAAALIASSRVSKWDLQVTWPGEEVRTYVRGDVTIGADISR